MSGHTSDRPSAGGLKVVAIGSSAGGIRALTAVLGGLDAGLPVPLLVVQHLDPRHDTVLADLLGRRTSLRVKLATVGERVRPAVAYLAPPNRHLLVDAGGVLALSDSEPVRFVRPSVDRLFGSVAEGYGSAALACVLTGTGSDGAAGVRAVKEHGGTVIVEDPETADFSGMPSAAVATGVADFVVPLVGIAPLIRDLVGVSRA
jgi:two-component system chemotaxis response regulator CheB